MGNGCSHVSRGQHIINHLGTTKQKPTGPTTGFNFQKNTFTFKRVVTRTNTTKTSIRSRQILNYRNHPNRAKSATKTSIKRRHRTLCFASLTLSFVNMTRQYYDATEEQKKPRNRSLRFRRWRNIVHSQI